MQGGTDDHFFEFDLDRAIRDQVIERLEASPMIALATSAGPAASGVYALYRHGALVYIGMVSKATTASKRTLRSRLNEHVTKIRKRRNIELSEMKFHYLVFESEWWVFAAEFALITHYSPEWNSSGFGSKVPGEGRPGTDRVSNWDDRFPLKSPEQLA